MLAKLILVVDDERKIGDIYTDWLGSLGYRVIYAGCAEEATEILIRQNVDLILLDLNMPGINGDYFYEVLQEYGGGSKVIVSSVYPIEIQKRRIPDADDYFDKSHGIYDLITKITVAFGADTAAAPR